MSPEDRRQPWPDSVVSRRRLLRYSLLAAAVPAATWWGAGVTPPALAASDKDDPGRAYREAFRAVVEKDPEVRAFTGRGREFLYRPGQILVADRDAQRVLDRLKKSGPPVRVGKGFAGVTRLLCDREVDIPQLVTWLRDKQQWSDVPPAVQPHHVTVGHENLMGNPQDAPVSALPLDEPARDRLGAGKGVLVGICDTGIWRDAHTFHPRWLRGGYLPEPDDEDPLYRYDDVLALQGGHGTFVAGVLRQAAPGVGFDPEMALSDSGIGDEAMLVAALDRLDPRVQIVNLSLGCYTQDDLPSLPLANRLAAFGKDAVVVASAGNCGTSRPSWPAALPEVLAVAAVTRGAETVAPAPYSNFGSWVNACAEGERTSTYVTGRLELPGAAPVIFPGFARWAGTSFAAPHVVGHLAAMMSTHGYTAAQARDRLLAGSSWHPDYGVLVG